MLATPPFHGSTLPTTRVVSRLSQRLFLCLSLHATCIPHSCFRHTGHPCRCPTFCRLLPLSLAALSLVASVSHHPCCLSPLPLTTSASCCLCGLNPLLLTTWPTSVARCLCCSLPVSPVPFLQRVSCFFLIFCHLPHMLTPPLFHLSNDAHVSPTTWLSCNSPRSLQPKNEPESKQHCHSGSFIRAVAVTTCAH